MPDFQPPKEGLQMYSILKRDGLRRHREGGTERGQQVAGCLQYIWGLDSLPNSSSSVLTLHSPYSVTRAALKLVLPYISFLSLVPLEHLLADFATTPLKSFHHEIFSRRRRPQSLRSNSFRFPNAAATTPCRPFQGLYQRRHIRWQRVPSEQCCNF